MNHRRRRGFTLIELLIVIGVIIVLVGLGFVGYNHVIASQRAKNTGIALDNAKSLFSTYQNVTHLRTVPPFIWTNGASTAYSSANPYPTDWDLWTTQLAAPSNASMTATSNDLPQDSALAFSLFLTIPENAKLVAGLPPTAARFPQPFNGSNPYKAGDIVKYDPSPGTAAPSFWVAKGSLAAGDTPPSTPTASNGSWAPSACGFLDGWGNPILYVPKGGMTGVTVGTQTGVMCSDGFHVAPFTPTNQQLQSLRPFFVSAGPDGDFSKGDDNIYSFEQ